MFLIPEPSKRAALRGLLERRRLAGSATTPLWLRLTSAWIASRSLSRHGQSDAGALAVDVAAVLAHATRSTP
jgi:hypothetical protein